MRRDHGRRVNEELSEVLQAQGIDSGELAHLVELALDEDLRFGPDVTTEATIDESQWAEAQVRARQPGVVCGVAVALTVLAATHFPLTGVTVVRRDGESVEAGDVVLQLSGPLRELLLGERTMLNFMSHLSGIATTTNAWVRALEGTDCRVRDTRKTTPGLRQLEKYAVRCGGGSNHRLGLGDAALVKDNHIEAAGGITEAVDALRRAHPDIPLEVECDSLEQVAEAARAGCSLLLLDNMSIEEITSAVAIVRSHPRTQTEASGGITLERAHDVAVAGVDYIAVGSLTHSVVALDLGLDIVATGSGVSA